MLHVVLHVGLQVVGLYDFIYQPPVQRLRCLRQASFIQIANSFRPTEQTHQSLRSGDWWDESNTDFRLPQFRVRRRKPEVTMQRRFRDGGPLQSR